MARQAATAKGDRKSAGRRSIGRTMVERLAEFHDALAAGADVGERFRITTREATVPKPGRSAAPTWPACGGGWT